jgi:plastocyanin
MWIHVGDTITWHFNVDEIHTVTFLRAGQTRLPFTTGCPGFTSDPASFDGSTCVTTPPLASGQTFTVAFPAAGNFKLVCLVHENMTAMVHVLDYSQPLPHDQAYYDREASRQARALLADADRGDHGGSHGHHVHGNAVTAGSGEVSATAGGSSTLSVMRFMEPLRVIHAGETIEWDNEDPVTPHTITFGTEPANPIPPSANVTIDPDGARHVVITSPSDSAHSGFIVAAPQERIGLPLTPPGVTRFRVTFTQAGVYPYICALHDDLGMKGQIIVLP